MAYKRIADSKFYFDVWYTIENPNSVFIKDNGVCTDKSFKSLDIGYYAREPFNSFKLTEDSCKLYKWCTIGMFVDTRKCGEDTIIRFDLSDDEDTDKLNLRNAEEYVAKILEHSCAKLDYNRNMKSLSHQSKYISGLKEDAKKLERIIQLSEKPFLENLYKIKWKETDPLKWQSTEPLETRLISKEQIISAENVEDARRIANQVFGIVSFSLHKYDALLGNFNEERDLAWWS